MTHDALCARPPPCPDIYPTPNETTSNYAHPQRCSVERIHFDPQASSTAGRRRRKATFREPSLLRATAGQSGGGVGAPGHGATGETGPDQVTRLTVVLENPADAQLLVSLGNLVLSACLCGEKGQCRRQPCFFGCGGEGARPWPSHNQIRSKTVAFTTHNSLHLPIDMYAACRSLFVHAVRVVDSRGRAEG